MKTTRRVLLVAATTGYQTRVFADEARLPCRMIALRGERAIIDDTMQQIHEGKLDRSHRRIAEVAVEEDNRRAGRATKARDNSDRRDPPPAGFVYL